MLKLLTLSALRFFVFHCTLVYTLTGTASARHSVFATLSPFASAQSECAITLQRYAAALFRHGRLPCDGSLSCSHIQIPQLSRSLIRTHIAVRTLYYSAQRMLSVLASHESERHIREGSQPMHSAPDEDNTVDFNRMIYFSKHHLEIEYGL